MELEKLIEEKFNSLNEQVKGSADKNAEEVKSLNEQIEALKQEVEEAKSKGLDMAKLQEQVDNLDLKMQQKNKNVVAENVTFDAVFAGVADEIVENLGNEAKTMNVFSKKFETKAAGNISFGNFANSSYGAITTATLPGVYQTPNADFYFRNIFPNAQTDSATIQFLKHVGGEGAAAVWDEKAEVLADKPLMDEDFDKATENVVWIAALATIHRSMLQDVPFLRTFIPQDMVYGKRGILIAENAYILSKLVSNSTAYNGTKTLAIERLYDAAFGQLGDGYYNCTHILLNHRDLINLIVMNKAVGSGEYDLPLGAVTVSNGKLYINGVQVLASPAVTAGKFFAIDNSVGAFFNRMSPEVEVSTEHKDNFSKNLVTFRAEERVALMIKDAKGIIYGDLEGVTSTTANTSV